MGTTVPTRLEMVIATISAVPTQPETEKAYNAVLALAQHDVDANAHKGHQPQQQAVTEAHAGFLPDHF